jgi:hypothetical protein
VITELLAVLASSHGIGVTLPHGWHETTRPLTSVTYPVQRLSFASFPLAQSGSDGDCAPFTALRRMPANGVLVQVIESTRPSPFGPIPMKDFPVRPHSFRLGRLEPRECGGTGYRIDFRDHRRFFQLDISVGPRLGGAGRATLLRVLNSLRVS